eukprot:gnl/TRDRNA2_/TRDRNA2_182522_c0_seq1.p1 gnl/TRDRNA2_/TRDRNA2_182522_c0~~gnl/TRDRNA2_/TRDRNA2_182522_c0_seq1.p1  ORF type:complete len:177 (+),score=21.20 gnl/TRDRNA2_/TRDRNA2_182522_c0_seq1:101-631(+)
MSRPFSFYLAVLIFAAQLLGLQAFGGAVKLKSKQFKQALADGGALRGSHTAEGDRSIPGGLRFRNRCHSYHGEGNCDICLKMGCSFCTATHHCVAQLHTACGSCSEQVGGVGCLRQCLPAKNNTIHLTSNNMTSSRVNVSMSENLERRGSTSISTPFAGSNQVQSLSASSPKRKHG